MTTLQSHQEFIQLLHRALRDERWREFISAEVRKHELPIIQFDAGTGRRSDAKAIYERPRSGE